MKKETIEKLFRRYIGIYDDVVFRTTGEHISENEINTVNDQVDQLFKEYEHIETLNDFTQFTKKIQEILTNTTELASKLNKEQQEKALNEIYWKFKNDPFGFIQERLDYVAKNIQVKDNPNDFYIPADPDLESIGKKYGIKYYYTYDPSTYVTPEELKKIKKSENEQIHAVLIRKTLQELDDYPIQFCKETFKKYFYDDKWDDKLLVLPNSIKNYIIMDIIGLGLKPHTDGYEKAVDLIFISKDKFKNNIANTNWDYLNELKYNFINNNLISRVEIINLFIHSWESLVFKNVNLSKNIKNDLLKKYSILFNNIDKIPDVSLIRFYMFMNNFNGGGSYKLLDGFIESLSDNSYLEMFANLVNIELTILINEFETIKFDKEQREFILNEKKYSNIINEYYKIFGDTNSISQEKDNESETYNIKDNDNNEEKQISKQLIKINTLYSLIKAFNKQYKYKYILENIKLKFKNIIKNIK